MQMPRSVLNLDLWHGRRTLGDRTRRATVLTAVLSVSGCAGLPQLATPPPASQALPLSTHTHLGKLALASMKSLANEVTRRAAPAMPDGGAPGLSGFRLLPLGTHSLDARLQLVRRAQSSLDVQYYHFANDSTGQALLRVLIDDLYTGGAEMLWLGFAAHANVEVRLFNPFTSARSSGPVGRFVAAPVLAQHSQPSGETLMKLEIARSLAAVGLVLGLSVLATSPAMAQAAGGGLTRAQVKMDRDTFLSMARWDETVGNYVLKEDMSMPEGVATRAQVKAMRDTFLSMHIWKDNESQWVPINGAPRDMSKLTRAQVKADTERFLKMYRFDESTSKYVPRR